MTSTLTPPSIRALMMDPVFVRFMKTPPRIPENLSWGNPWEVRALRDDDRWAYKQFHTYRDAWTLFVRAFRDPNKYTDVTIISRRKFFGPPAHLVWDPAYSWCPRCRRPSSFFHTGRHPALKIPILTSDEPYLCFYCGQRFAVIPNYVPHHGQ